MAKRQTKAQKAGAIRAAAHAKRMADSGAVKIAVSVWVKESDVEKARAAMKKAGAKFTVTPPTE